MDHSNQNKMHTLREKVITIRDFIIDHSKIIMPLVLIVCVIITVIIAVNANHRDALEREAQQAAMAVPTEEEQAVSMEGLELPEYELEENAHPEINNLVRAYYDAQASGDVDVISELNTYLDEIEIIRVQEMSKYVESYPELNVYTKPGLTEGAYVAYVCSEVKFSEMEQELPGMQTFYIGLNDDGSYFINDGTNDTNITNYIKKITLQDDVVDLNNKVVVEYNELLAEDEELEEYIAYLKDKINEDVGEILAQAEQPEADSSETDPVEETKPEEPLVAKTVRATDVVNIRSSDSEEADRIDKAQIGQEFQLLEERGNGWSKVSHNGKEVFIKSDYLEVVEEKPVETAAVQEEEQDNTPDTPADSNETTSGTVTVKEGVKIRKSASTDSESLGTAYAGTKLELIMKQADGWTKIKYKGQTAFVKSDYVE